MNGPLTRASFHLERAKGLVGQLAELAAMGTLLPNSPFDALSRSLRAVRQELERAERDLRDAGTWTGDAGAGDRLRGIAIKVMCGAYRGET